MIRFFGQAKNTIMMLFLFLKGSDYFCRGKKKKGIFFLLLLKGSDQLFCPGKKKIYTIIIIIFAQANY